MTQPVLAEGSPAQPPVEAAAEPAPAPSRVKTDVRTLLGVLVGLTVAGVAGYFLGVKPAEVAQHVADMAPWALGLSVVSGFVMIGLQSLRWHAVMKPLLGLRYLQA